MHEDRRRPVVGLKQKNGEETGTRSPNDSALLLEDATEESSCCIDWAARNNADEAVERRRDGGVVVVHRTDRRRQQRVAADAMPPLNFLVDEAALTAVRMAWRFWVVSHPLDNL